MEQVGGLRAPCPHSEELMQGSVLPQPAVQGWERARAVAVPGSPSFICACS